MLLEVQTFANSLRNLQHRALLKGVQVVKSVRQRSNKGVLNGVKMGNHLPVSTVRPLIYSREHLHGVVLNELNQESTPASTPALATKDYVNIPNMARIIFSMALSGFLSGSKVTVFQSGCHCIQPVSML